MSASPEQSPRWRCWRVALGVLGGLPDGARVKRPAMPAPLVGALMCAGGDWVSALKGECDLPIVVAAAGEHRLLAAGDAHERHAEHVRRGRGPHAFQWTLELVHPQGRVGLVLVEKAECLPELLTIGVLEILTPEGFQELVAHDQRLIEGAARHATPPRLRSRLGARTLLRRRR